MSKSSKSRKTLKDGFTISSLILFIIGILFIFGSEYFLEDNQSNILWNGFRSLGIAIIIASIFDAINNFYLKEKMVDLILEKMQLKEAIHNTGISEIVSDLNDLDYRHYIRNSRESIDIYHVYGRTWTNNNIEAIKNKLLHSNCKIRVVLLSPDSKFVEPLAERYGVTKEELISNIDYVRNCWLELIELKKHAKKKNQSSLRIYYTNAFPVYSLYRFDNTMINILSKPSKGRTSTLPTFICEDSNKESDLYSMYLKEFDEIVTESIEIQYQKPHLEMVR